jgi:uncharacterized protein involved in response to NO
MLRITLFRIGFRPFFLGAALYACGAMIAWYLVYQGYNVQGATRFGAIHWWHAHGMIFGYATAVIAGFLLTAVRNWTGRATLNGGALALLFVGWATARILPFLGTPLLITALVDLLFNLGLIVAVTTPLVQAKQWQNIGIFTSKLIVLMLANAMVYLGAYGAGPGQRFGVYLGLYVVLAITMTIGNRVFPFFIRRGLNLNDNLKTVPMIARANLVTFSAFCIGDLLWPGTRLVALLAGILAIINSWRLWTWTRREAWSVPMLWVLILGYGWLIVGFAMLCLQIVDIFPRALGIHALTVGGIGMLTLGMMARVALGHTGRAIYAPKRLLNLCFTLTMAAAITRAIAPIIGINYRITILSAQGLWTAAFGLFIVIYTPILLSPRVDGKPD